MADRATMTRTIKLKLVELTTCAPVGKRESGRMATGVETSRNGMVSLAIRL
jgi:hypothetical protein